MLKKALLVVCAVLSLFFIIVSALLFLQTGQMIEQKFIAEVSGIYYPANITVNMFMSLSSGIIALFCWAGFWYFIGKSRYKK